MFAPELKFQDYVRITQLKIDAVHVHQNESHRPSVYDIVSCAEMALVPAANWQLGPSPEPTVIFP